MARHSDKGNGYGWSTLNKQSINKRQKLRNEKNEEKIHMKQSQWSIVHNSCVVVVGCWHRNLVVKDFFFSKIGRKCNFSAKFAAFFYSSFTQNQFHRQNQPPVSFVWWPLSWASTKLKLYDQPNVHPKQWMVKTAQLQVKQWCRAAANVLPKSLTK